MSFLHRYRIPGLIFMNILTSLYYAVIYMLSAMYCGRFFKNDFMQFLYSFIVLCVVDLVGGSGCS